MNRTKALEHLRPLLELVVSLEGSFTASIPLLYELAALGTGKGTGSASVLMNRIKRRYLRLCRVQEELGRLDFKKANPADSPEDYVFSQIDFSRYKEIHERTFNTVFLEGIDDFGKTFFQVNFSLAREELHALLEKNYEKIESMYKLKRENPMILSIMRTLETSLEDLPLFSFEEIEKELNRLSEFTENHVFMPEIKEAYPLLLFCLDGMTITHKDGMSTRLFVSDDGALSATFQPGGKPWTRVLISIETKS